MIYATIDGRKVSIPTSWKEVPYRDFVELSVLGNDLVAQVAYLLGMTKKEFEGGTFSEGLDTIFKATKFLSKFEVNEFPQTIGKYSPGNQIRTMAQLNAIALVCEQNAQASSTRATMESMALIAAIQCQGLAEPFDLEKARYLSKDFMNLPCLEVYETGNFFHAKALSIVWRKDIHELRKSMKFTKPSFFKRMQDKWRSR